MRHHNIRLMLLTAVLLLAGCASIPEPLEGDFAPVTLQTARAGSADGQVVRWGGSIIKAEPGQDQTCFFILAQPLDAQARPKSSSDSPGRFVACKSGFYDPEVFRKGRELTVTGTLAGSVQHKVGDFNYTYPKVAADKVYLWPLRPMYSAAPASPWGPWSGYYDPFWSPGWYGWSPAWYPRPIIVVPKNQAPRRPPKKS